MESKIGSIRNVLRTLLVDEQVSKWDVTLPLVTFELNCMIDKSLMKSPLAIVYGREPRIRADNWLPDTAATLQDRIIYLRQRDKQVSRISSRSRDDDYFKEGDLVLLRSTAKADERENKLKDLYVGT